MTLGSFLALVSREREPLVALVYLPRADKRPNHQQTAELIIARDSGCAQTPEIQRGTGTAQTRVQVFGQWGPPDFQAQGGPASRWTQSDPLLLCFVFC